MSVYSPPKYPDTKGKSSIFLAGSIEMGKARNWQAEFISMFQSLLLKSPQIEEKWVILNPRRWDWDSSWEQSITNAQFYQQVDWELTFLERATHRIFYFAEDTISPISLLELGKFGAMENSYVVTEHKYERKGNVDIFCHRYQIPIYPHMNVVFNKIFKS